MKVRRWLLGSMLAALAVCQAFGQTPTVSGIEAPYPAVQSMVRFGGVGYGKGAVAYGPAGTPLILSGKNFGDSGTVQFPGCTVSATVTDWTPSILMLSVPPCAVTGLVTVSTTVGATALTSNGWLFMVTKGAYSGGICPAFPSRDQLSITTSSLPDGMVGQSYDATLAAAGGSPPYSWSLTGSSTLPAGLSLSASSGAITGTPTAVAEPMSLSVSLTDGMSETETSSLQLTIDAAPSPPSTIYTYIAGYDGDGNVQIYDDSVMGVWSFSYDNLNRLMSATPLPNEPSAYAGQQLCMNYDSFGNRTQSNLQTNPCNPANDPATARYNVANQVTWTSVNSAVNGFAYDAAGNVLNDAENSYVYDGQGRLCAMQTSPVTGGTIAYGYIYDAEGRRVARGTITPTTPLSCNPATNGFQLIEGYVLGQGGEQLSNYTSNGKWERTNVYGGGQQLATYDIPSGSAPALHFQLTDPLGTRRVQTAADGTAEENCQSLPFGDALNCGTVTGAPATADDDNHLHFTGKERDPESGLDYFGARYYGSNMGRFMSPDEPFVDQNSANPQSWNLYSYGRNNPVTNTDDDGRSVNVCDNNGQCNVVSNDAYTAAQQGNNGGLNVPTLDQVGTNGSGSITDSSENKVGSATYVSDGNLDYYANAAGYQQLAGASRVVNAVAGAEMSIMAPWAAAAAQCTMGGSKAACAGNMALSILPEVGELRAGAQLIKAGRGLAAAEILEKAGGFTQATKDFEALNGAEKTLGNVKVKELSDGSKAVLRNFSGDGRPTLEIQNATGTTKVRYN